MIFITRWNAGHLTFKSTFLNNVLVNYLTFNAGKKVIQDRTIYEDAHIFNLHAMGLLTKREL